MEKKSASWSHETEDLLWRDACLSVGHEPILTMVMMRKFIKLRGGDIERSCHVHMAMRNSFPCLLRKWER